MWNERSFLFLLPVGVKLLRSAMNGFWDPTRVSQACGVFALFSLFFWLTRGFLMYYSGTASSPCCSVNPWATSTVEPPWSPTSPTPQQTTWRRWPRCSWPPASIAWRRRSPRYFSFRLYFSSLACWGFSIRLVWFADIYWLKWISLFVFQLITIWAQ